VQAAIFAVGLVILAAVSATPAVAQGSTSGLGLRITEPEDGEYIFGKTKIVADVRSRDPIEGLRVEFSVGGRLVFIDQEAPWECFHDFGDQARSWVVEAKAIAPDGLNVSHTIITRRLEIHYREEVDRVLVTLSITGKEHEFVEGLTRDDFKVSEDKQEQKILEFGVERRPITLGVLIDTSGSMKEEIGQVQAAAKDFVTSLRPEDRAFVVDFDENVFLLQDLTNDHDLLQASIEGTDAEGGTALYDALYVSYRKVRSIEGRKAIAVLTDGNDTNSAFSFQRVLELTRTHDVILYTIGLGATLLDRGMRSSLSELSDESGGRAFFPRTAKDLADVYQRIAADLRNQYFLTYSSANREFDGSWRKIKVECSAEDAKVKTRRGYYAVKN
jgi:VWFA-related protein